MPFYFRYEVVGARVTVTEGFCGNELTLRAISFGRVCLCGTEVVSWGFFIVPMLFWKEGSDARVPGSDMGLKF